MANSNITRNALAESLISLGLHKDIDKITVAEIVEKCGVNRQTFYYHFDDKYELLRWIYQTRVFDKFQDGLTFNNWEEKMLEALKVVGDLKEFALNTINCSNNVLQFSMQESLIIVFKMAIENISGLNHRTLSDTDEELYARFLTYGFTGIITDWILGKFKATPETVVEKIKVMFIKAEGVDLKSLIG